MTVQGERVYSWRTWEQSQRRVKVDSKGSLETHVALELVEQRHVVVRQALHEYAAHRRLIVGERAVEETCAVACSDHGWVVCKARASELCTLADACATRPCGPECTFTINMQPDMVLQDGVDALEVLSRVADDAR